MSNTITVRLPKSVAAWLEEKSLRTGIPQGQIIREQLEQLRRADAQTKRFMRLAGSVEGPPDLSQRKGFARL